MTIAREASNFQKRKEIATGKAFWTEKIVTNRIMAASTINMLTFPP